MSYSDEIIDKVWRKAVYLSEKNEKSGYRMDMCGARINKDNHGKEGDFGWEVDHIYPESKAKEKGVKPELYNDIVNLQPLHHKNNGSEGKSDDYPIFLSAITSNGSVNIVQINSWTISTSTQKTIKKNLDL